MPYPNYTTAELAAINAYLQNEANLARDQRNLLVEINKELAGQINYQKEASKQYGILRNITEDLLNDSEEMGKLSEKELEKLRTKASLSLTNLKLTAEDLKQQVFGNNKIDLRNKAFRSLGEKQQSLLRGLKDGFKLEEKTLELVARRVDYQKNLNKNVGLTGALLKSTAELTNKLGLHGVDHIFEDASISATNMAKGLMEANGHALGIGGKMKVMGAAIGPLASGLFKAFSDPLFLIGLTVIAFKKLYNSALEYDAILVKTGRTLALNREQTEKLYERSAAYAQTQHDSFVTTKRLFEAQTQLNEALGTSVTFSDESAESFAKLTHYYGLSAESAAKLEELGQVNKGTSDDIKKTILATAGAQKLQYGGGIAYQKVLDKVANISSDIYIKFKGNVKAITEAVMQADRLGLSLEQADQAGESLLNFESSIENELKAELLTGKAINLEKARSAALSGDTAKLTKEIVSEVGNIHEFEQMNVIQRKAYADAFGLNVKDMSEMLRKQQFQAALGDKVTASAEEQLKFAKQNKIEMSDVIEQELERKSLADEQKNIMDKLKDVLNKIMAGPMGKFAHMMEKVLGYVVGIIERFGKITGGGLGNALGAALLGLPLALMSFRLLKGTFVNPMITKDISMTRMGGGGGGGGMMMGGGGAALGTKGNPVINANGTKLYGQAATNYAQKAGMVGGGGAVGGGGFMSRMGGGIGLGVAGMGLNMAAGSMKEGTGKEVVSGLGSMAGMAGMGFMVGGPVGAGIGALVGLTTSIFSSMEKSDERAKAEAAKRKEDDKKYQDMVEALYVRPLQLNIGNESVAKFSTQQSLTNSNPNYP